MLFPAAKVIIKHPTEKNTILLLKRQIKAELFYEPPGGRVEYDAACKVAEKLEECALREVKEELGVDVRLGRYIGSYYFFWTIDPRICSLCAVFTAAIDMTARIDCSSNADPHEGSFEPVWVTQEEVVQDRIVIHENLVGLKKILLRCFK